MTVSKDKSILKYLPLFFMILGISACNMDHHITPAQPELTQQDEVFMANATVINLKGTEFAMLAVERSSNGLVLAYAQRMIEEYSAAGNVLGAMAGDFEVNIPDILPPDHQLERDQLSAIEGAAFDSIYLQRNIDNHIWSHEIMEGQINESNVEELVQYASQQLLLVNERLNDALLIQSELP